MMPPADELRRDFLLAPACDGSVAPAPASGPRVIPWGPAALPEGEPAHIAIGAFDGCHIGHRRLIRETLAYARGRGEGIALAVTFDPDPDSVVGPGSAPKLMTVKDRLEALRSLGISVLVVPFTHKVAAMDHVAFFDMLGCAGLRVRSVHVGSDFRLGAGGASTVETVRAWGAPIGVDVRGYDLVRDDGEPVSATRIRALLAQGGVRDAARELGRRYAVRGRVVSGRGEGTGMGFPTANIEVPAGMQLPADGVYSGLALVNGSVWPAAVNVGVPPTFAGRDHAAYLEANLLGFDGDLYGERIMLTFCRRIRPSVRFASTQELVRTVLADIESIRSEYGETGVALA